MSGAYYPARFQNCFPTVASNCNILSIAGQLPWGSSNRVPIVRNLHWVPSNVQNSPTYCKASGRGEFCRPFICITLLRKQWHFNRYCCLLKRSYLMLKLCRAPLSGQFPSWEKNLNNICRSWARLAIRSFTRREAWEVWTLLVAWHLFLIASCYY